MKKISVIVPVYNKEKYIERTIKSVLKQTYSKFELILVNDGSTDTSEQIIKKFSDDKRIVYHFQNNGGVSVARNTGIGLATGEYITFLDADDRWDSTFLEEMIRNISNSDVCYSGHYVVLNNSICKSKISFREGDIVIDYIHNKTYPHTNSWLISRKLIENNEIKFPKKLNWGEDFTFFFKVLYHAKNVVTTKKYLTYYSEGVENNLSYQSVKKIDQDIIWMKQCIQYISDNGTKSKRDQKIIRAFKSYRLPAAIIYRIISLSKDLNPKELTSMYSKYQCYFTDIDLSNGLRSIKLILHFLKLRRDTNVRES